jgi:hypothetical protein
VYVDRIVFSFYTMFERQSRPGFENVSQFEKGD